MNFKALSKTSLFYGTTPREAEAMLNCLGAVQQCFTKGKTIYHMGDSVTSLGMVPVSYTHLFLWLMTKRWPPSHTVICMGCGKRPSDQNKRGAGVCQAPALF